MEDKAHPELDKAAEIFPGWMPAALDALADVEHEIQQKVLADACRVSSDSDSVLVDLVSDDGEHDAFMKSMIPVALSPKHQTNGGYSA